MAQSMETNSLCWAELTEGMDTDSDLQSECGFTTNTEKDEVETATKDVRCKQMSDNDLRKKLNKKRGLEDHNELQATTSKTKGQGVCAGNKYAQRKPENDLRMKLNRNRGETLYDSSDSQREKHSPLNRSKYTHRSGGLSPLRSPINRNKQKTIFDIDNSRNFRFTKNRAASQTQLQQRENRDDHKCIESPNRSEKHKCSVKSDGIGTTLDNGESGSNTSVSDYDKDTPGHSGTPRQKSRQSWSRRKLHLPSENNASKDISTESVPEAKEDDVLKLARRDKDIVYGKNTFAYQMYVEEVPVLRRICSRCPSNNCSEKPRQRIMKVHPDTPDKFRKCSRRSWDSQVKIWKLRLHALAAELKKDRDMISDILQETHLQAEDSSSESKTDDEDFLDILNDDTFDLSDKRILTEDA